MKISIYKTTLVSALLALTSLAHAVSLTPATVAVAKGNETSEAAIQALISGWVGSLDLLYKATQADGSELGSFAADYSTDFSNGATDQFAHAYITHDVGQPAINSDPVYAYIRDGNYTNYNWYLFKVDGWNGTDAINFDGFFNLTSTSSKNISHVSLYGKDTPSVPDNGSVALLLGTSLLGLALISRRRK